MPARKTERQSKNVGMPQARGCLKLGLEIAQDALSDVPSYASAGRESPRRRRFTASATSR